jgi:hypothetical protein
MLKIVVMLFSCVLVGGLSWLTLHRFLRNLTRIEEERWGKKEQ